ARLGAVATTTPGVIGRAPVSRSSLSMRTPARATLGWTHPRVRATVLCKSNGHADEPITFLGIDSDAGGTRGPQYRGRCSILMGGWCGSTSDTSQTKRREAHQGWICAPSSLRSTTRQGLTASSASLRPFG